MIFGNRIIKFILIPYRRLNFGNLKYLKINSHGNGTYELLLCNNSKKNALNFQIFKEIVDSLDHLDKLTECRSIILHGDGDCFSSGMDFKELNTILSEMHGKISMYEKSNYSYLNIRELQKYISHIENIKKPIINVMHGSVIGAGIALSSVSDIRYSTPSCKFQIKEILMGFPSDMGILQRLPLIGFNDSFLREVALTGRVFDGKEAHANGFCQILPEILCSQPEKYDEMEAKEKTLKHCIELAQQISELNPAAVEGTKANLNYSRKDIERDLEYAAQMNSSLLQDPKIIGYAKKAMNMKISK